MIRLAYYRWQQKRAKRLLSLALSDKIEAMDSDRPLARYLRELRETKGMSLRQVERATGGAVSNVYLSQLELGKRHDPNPRILVALSKVYGVRMDTLLERAGYLDAPEPPAIDVAFQQVLADPTFDFGTRFEGKELDETAKRVIIELYEKVTGKTLLKDERVNEERQDSPSGHT